MGTARQQSPREPSDGAPATLGDVLYADRQQTLAREADWVQLVRAIAGGDQAALHSLYERTHRVVFTLTLRLTGCRETAEELTLDVFHDVWRRAGRYDPAGGTVLGWIMNQARSRAIDRMRFERRKKRSEPEGEQPLIAEQSTSGESLVELNEQCMALRGAMTALAPEERRAIETAFFSEMSYAQAAQRLHVPLGTIKTRIRSGLHKLRQALAAGVKEP
jgi:RNA polymerase sigma-70 factor, ECF subfamily